MIVFNPETKTTWPNYDNPLHDLVYSIINIDETNNNHCTVYLCGAGYIRFHINAYYWEPDLPGRRAMLLAISRLLC